MIRIVEWAIANSLTVALLAPVVFLVGHLSKQPAVRHGLWILLLIKLITPPLVPVDVKIPDLFQATTPAVDAAPVSDAATLVPASPSRGALLITPSSPSKAGASDHVMIARRDHAAATTDIPVLPLPDATPAPAARSVAPTIPPVPSVFWPAAARAMLLAWLVGTMVCFVVQGSRLVWFTRRLKRAAYRSAALEEEMQSVLETLEGTGKSRSPRVLMVNGVVSPMLWGVGRRATILFPAELHSQLQPEARKTLLLHELAHYHRGDSWVRVLEFVNIILFWWHPVTWWSRREIESSEEECCDQWVMGRTASSPRCYAEALLDTIDFLCERHPLAPPVSSGLGNPRELRGRLVKIMRGPGEATITAAGRVLLALVLVGLPIQPQALASLGGSFRDVLLAGADKEDFRLDAAPPSLLTRATEPVSTQAVPSSAASPVVPQKRSGSHEWAVASSKDGRFQIRARTGKRVDLVDQLKGRTVPLTDWNIASTVFLPGRDEFVTGGFDRQIRLWDAVSGTIRSTFGESSEAVLSVAAAADGRQIAAGSRGGEVTVYGTADLSMEGSWTFEVPVNSVRFSPAGDRLLVSLGGWRSESPGELAVIDLASGDVASRIRLDRPVGIAEFSADPEIAATGGWDGRIDFVRLDSGRSVASVVRPKDIVSAGAFSQDTSVFPGAGIEESRQDGAHLALEGMRRLLGSKVEGVAPAARPAAER